VSAAAAVRVEVVNEESIVEASLSKRWAR